MISLACIAATCAATPANEERDHVRVAALRFIMMKHASFGSERQYYAYYVLRDIEYVRHFADFRPLVVAFENQRYPTSSGRAIDAKTGRPVKIWSIGDETIEGAKATVGISWYSGNAGGGSHTVFLEKKDRIWSGISERRGGLSQKEPNRALEPTTTAVTPRADARPAMVRARL